MPRKSSGDLVEEKPVRTRRRTAVKRTTKKKTDTTLASSEVTEEQLRERAYYIYLERVDRQTDGNPESDWRQAELEMCGELAVK